MSVTHVLTVAGNGLNLEGQFLQDGGGFIGIMHGFIDAGDTWRVGRGRKTWTSVLEGGQFSSLSTK